MYNEYFGFLSERLTDSNLETDFFYINRNPCFSRIPDPKDLEKELLLLKFKQRIWEIPEGILKEKFTPYYCMYYDKMKDQIPLFMHDIIYNGLFKNKINLEHSISCVPTLSFRTLVLDKQNHIKFGLPFFYGGLVRRNEKEEILASLYLSDYIRGLPTINKLEFFGEFKGYSFSDLTDFGVSYRKRESTEELMPISCYFNKILNHSSGAAHERLERAFDFVSDFFKDFNAIYEYLYRAGLGLEIHGQNLMVKLDNVGNSKRAYVYRDLGNCTLEPKIQRKQTELNKYYKSTYNYVFNKKKQAPAAYYAWQNYRTFFLSFLIYNLNELAVQEQLKINAYNWFEKVIETLPNIKEIYSA